MSWLCYVHNVRNTSLEVFCNFDLVVHGCSCSVLFSLAFYSICTNGVVNKTGAYICMLQISVDPL